MPDGSTGRRTATFLVIFAVAVGIYLFNTPAARIRLGLAGQSPMKMRGLGQASAPSIGLIDSVVLQEFDSLYVGRPTQFPFVDSLGRIYLADELFDRVLRFTPDGKIDRQFGQHGQGPGELAGVGPYTGFLWDSLLIVPAYSTARLTAFDSRTGSYVGQASYTGHVSGSGIQGDSALLGVVDLGSQKVVTVLPRHALRAGTAGGIEAGGLLTPTVAAAPSEYKKHPYLRMYAEPFVLTIRPDTVLLAFGGLNYVVRYVGGRAQDTVEVPFVRRRGVSDAALRLFDGGAAEGDAAHSVSTVLGLWRLPDGAIVIWHQDPTVRFRGKAVAELTGRAFVSVLSPDLRQACIDGEVMAPGTSRPRLALQGRTLYSVDQEVSDSTSRVITVVRRYSVDTSTCKWTPTRMRSGPR